LLAGKSIMSESSRHWSYPLWLTGLSRLRKKIWGYLKALEHKFMVSILSIYEW
jgi:hypothetical protein